MTRVIEEPGALPIHIWARRPPEEAVKQLRRIARQPWVVERVAAMPDLHVAKGVAVGTVFATADTIVPSALGGDLGCGVSALRFPTDDSALLDPRTLRELLGRLSAAIPVGDALHRDRRRLPDALLDTPLSTGALEHFKERRAGAHLGTLGGGNHFVELDRDAEGSLWLLVHSGSRGAGAAIAAHHLRVAEERGEGELPGLRVESPEGAACLADTAWANSFARMNRQRLLAVALDVLSPVTGVPGESAIDVQHNFVREELHEGRRLFIHRKGAISAERGARAVIPGTMGTATYIVEGLGETSSFRSGSHGAGRVLTRTEARKQIRPEKLVHSMKRVIFDERRARSLVEEAPAAYRDIREVLEDEADLIAPVRRLEPLAVLKG